MALTSRVDHIMTVVADLDRAAEAYQRLGFTLTERGHHTGQGTMNRLAMLDGDYLELIAIEAPTERNGALRRQLAEGREGIAALALACDDDEAAAQRLAQAGIGRGPPERLSRPVQLPEGAREARFGIVKVKDDALPCGPMFFCRHYTPEVVWRPEWQRHANGARRIGAVVAVHADPARCRASYAQFLGPDAVTAAPRGLEVRFGRTPLLILDPPGAAEWSAGAVLVANGAAGRTIGLVLEVESLARTRELLARSVVEVREPGCRLVVPPGAGCGATIELVQR